MGNGYINMLLILGCTAMFLASLATGFIVKESCTVKNPFLGTRKVWMPDTEMKGGDDE